MRKIYIAFLGIAPYLNCNYVYNDTKVDNVKYIQEAMIKLLCKDFSESDKYIFFLTKDAEKENWNDKSENKGLANTLNEFIPKDNIIKISNFPEGKNENEIWKMFELIYEQINDNDEILVDITHSFRYIPMLMLLILNYAEYMKNYDYKSGLDLFKNKDNVFVLRTFSKIFGLASLRVGWGYGSKKIINALNVIKPPFNVSHIGQMAATESLKDQNFITPI